MKLTQRLDLNLYHLYLTLVDLQSENYGEEINLKLREFTNEVCLKAVDEPPIGFDIVETECILITKLKK